MLQQLSSAGLPVNKCLGGQVLSLSPGPGSRVPPGTVVTIQYCNISPQYSPTTYPPDYPAPSTTSTTATMGVMPTCTASQINEAGGGVRGQTLYLKDGECTIR
jgi:beta-lactam-binding protein with PASTA domain